MFPEFDWRRFWYPRGKDLELSDGGFLADPEYGGNRNRAGWRVIGFSPAHIFRPPFGEYDREV